MRFQVHSVLLVDDNEAVNFAHKKLISTIDDCINIAIAEDGSEAIAHLENTSGTESYPDIIFLDINMPGMDGWQFLDTFEENYLNKSKAIIIVMVTTSFNPEDKKKFESYKFVHQYLNKPLKKSDVSAVFSEYFSRMKRGDNVFA